MKALAASKNQSDAKGLCESFRRRFKLRCHVFRHTDGTDEWRVNFELPADEAMADYARAYVSGFVDARADTMWELDSQD